MACVVHSLLLVLLFALVSLIQGLPTSQEPTPGPTTEGIDDAARIDTRCYPGSDDSVDEDIQRDGHPGSGGEPGLVYGSGDFVMTRTLLKTLPGRPNLDLVPPNDSESTIKYWTEENTIYYTIAANESTDETIITEINIAMEIWAYDTCVRFVELRDEYLQYYQDYVEIGLENTGCYSDTIGRKGGIQVVNIDPEQCGSDIDAIVHVLGQVIGLRDKDMSFDLRASYRESYTFTRDNYTYTVWEHLPGTQAYDPLSDNYSVMLKEKVVHPDSKQHLPTLLNCKGQVVKQRLSKHDIDEVNKIYSCGINHLLQVEVIALVYHDLLTLNPNSTELYVQAAAKNDEEAEILMVTKRKNIENLNGDMIIAYEDPIMSFKVGNWERLTVEVRRGDENEDEAILMAEDITLTKGSTIYALCDRNDCSSGVNAVLVIRVQLELDPQYCLFHKC